MLIAPAALIPATAAVIPTTMPKLQRFLLVAATEVYIYLQKLRNSAHIYYTGCSSSSDSSGVAVVPVPVASLLLIYIHHILDAVVVVIAAVYAAAPVPVGSLHTQAAIVHIYKQTGSSCSDKSSSDSSSVC
jgi:hypothetical protein